MSFGSSGMKREARGTLQQVGSWRKRIARSRGREGVVRTAPTSAYLASSLHHLLHSEASALL